MKSILILVLTLCLPVLGLATNVNMQKDGTTSVVVGNTAFSNQNYRTVATMSGTSIDITKAALSRSLTANEQESFSATPTTDLQMVVYYTTGSSPATVTYAVPVYAYGITNSISSIGITIPPNTTYALNYNYSLARTRWEVSVAATGTQTLPQSARAQGDSILTNRVFSAPMANVGSSISFQLRAGIPFVNRTILVRFVNMNDTSTGYTISNVAFAGGATTAINPVDAGGSPSVWSTDTSVVVSAGSASWVTDGSYGIGYGNWKLVNIPSRTDGGTFGVLYTRAYSSAAFRGPVGNGSRDLKAYAGLSINEFMASDYQTGNFVSGSQASFNPTTGLNSQFYPIFFEISVPDRIITVAGVGDSTTQGLGSTGCSWSAVQQACQALATTARPIALANWAYEGKQTDFFYPAAKSMLADANARPQVMVIQAGSQNNTWTQSNAQTMYLQMMDLVRQCRSYSVIPILRCPYPTSVNDATADAARLWMRSQVIASNIIYIDAESTVGTGATPNRLQPAYTADGVHLNDAGETAVSPLVQVALNASF